MQRDDDDILINKVSSIKKCVERAREEYSLASDDKKGFYDDFSRQDAAILNILRAYEQAIDLANHIVRLLDVKVPNDSCDSFELLLRQKIIDEILCEKMKKMIGFRNISIHEYQKLNIDIVESVIIYSSNDLLKFAEVILDQNKKIKILGKVRKIKFSHSEEINEFEKEEIKDVMLMIYEYYKDNKNNSSDLLNRWKKSQILRSISSYNSKFYTAWQTALLLFFTDEENISKDPRYHPLSNGEQKIEDQDIKKYIESI